MEHFLIFILQSLHQNFIKTSAPIEFQSTQIIYAIFIIQHGCPRILRFWSDLVKKRNYSFFQAEFPEWDKELIKNNSKEKI